MIAMKDLKRLENSSSVGHILSEYFECDEDYVIEYMFNDGIAHSLCWCDRNHIELDSLLDQVESSLRCEADFHLTDSYNSVLKINSIELPMNWFVLCD